MTKFHVDVSSSGYYDVSPDKKYIVDVACVTKKRGGQLVDRHYEVKAMLGKEYNKAKEIDLISVNDHEAGSNVNLVRDDVKWSLENNIVVVKIGNTNITVKLDSATNLSN